MKQLLSNKNVMELINQFDLDFPKMVNIYVDNYELDNGRIVILSAKILDDELNFIRFADLSKLIDHLSECNVIFKK